MLEPEAQPAQVVIAGGGVAGIEAALALREFAGDAARVIVVDPGRRFAVPGTATGRAFGLSGGPDLRLADAVSRAGAELVGGRLQSVDPGRHLATLAGGRIIRYHALVVAVGAVPVSAVPGALTFSGLRDVEAVRGLIDDLVVRGRRGAGAELVIAVPPGCGWPLAAYELALMAHEHLLQHHAGAATVRVVTSEDAPLDLFGEEAGATVTRMLERAGIPLRKGAAVVGWDAGRLMLADGSSIGADRAIALPVYRGPSIDGLPSDALGFIPVRPEGAVEGLADVWAVGDGTTFPVKQGAVACRQADVAAGAIAAALGAGGGGLPPTAAAGWIWDGRRGRHLPSGAPAPDPDRPGLAWPVAKVGGRFLAPFLHSLMADGLAAGPAEMPA